MTAFARSFARGAVAVGSSLVLYANGTWLLTTEIPPDRASYGASAIVTELTLKRTAELIRHAALETGPVESTARKRQADPQRDTVRNIDAWYDAFDVKAGQALYLAPSDRVRVW